MRNPNARPEIRRIKVQHPTEEPRLHNGYRTDGDTGVKGAKAWDAEAVKASAKWLGRFALLGLGLSIGAALISKVESEYRIHETQIATRPIFDPPGLKYAQVYAPEKDGIRGWVADMVPPPKRAGVKRVLAVGDSLTWGLGVSRTQAWPAQLESMLHNTEVFNLGMCGYDAEQGVSLITHHLDTWKPDLVIWATYPNDLDPTFLMFGAHDKHPVFVGTSIPEPAQFAPEWISLWLVRHSAMFRQIQAAKLSRVLANGYTPAVSDVWYTQQLQALERWSRTTATPVLALAIPDHTQADPERCATFISEKDCRDQKNNYARVTQALRQSGLTWIDGQRLYAASGRPHFMGADRDSGHPLPAGHTVLATGLVDIVRNQMDKRN
jgi:lysophospholipase L1-like esterase